MSWHRNFILGISWPHLDQVSRSSGQGHIVEMLCFCYLDISLTWFVLSEVKIINEVKVIPRSNCKCLTFCQQVGGGPSTERHSRMLCMFPLWLQKDEWSRLFQCHFGIIGWFCEHGSAAPFGKSWICPCRNEQESNRFHDIIHDISITLADFHTFCLFKTSATFNHGTSRSQF